MDSLIQLLIQPFNKDIGCQALFSVLVQNKDGVLAGVGKGSNKENLDEGENGEKHYPANNSEQ